MEQSGERRSLGRVWNADAEFYSGQSQSLRYV